MNEYTVRWTVRLTRPDGVEIPRVCTAGPMSKISAERFAIGLSTTVGPQLGDVKIEPVEENRT